MRSLIMSVILQVVEASAALMYTIDFVIFTFQCGVRVACLRVGTGTVYYYKEGTAVDEGESAIIGKRIGCTFCTKLEIPLVILASWFKHQRHPK